jgi:hypothetical protein
MIGETPEGCAMSEARRQDAEHGVRGRALSHIDERWHHGTATFMITRVDRHDLAEGGAWISGETIRLVHHARTLELLARMLTAPTSPRSRPMRSPRRRAGSRT